MIIQKHTIQHRLKHWGEWSQEPRRDWGRSSSPFGKIAEMHENAGIHADGIRYEILTVDGQSFSCPPDGGMSAEVERQGRAMAHDIRCREVEEAVSNLPQAHRLAIIHTYVVPRREKPRSTRAVSDLMSCSHTQVARLLSEAHERLARRIYGEFEIVAVSDAAEEGEPQRHAA